ncbi:MAG: hypothetical protein JOZ77_10820 [Candidatus Eremiobacteraeota bacterium]|nr:hypothetical protein [Candidatus Eremiobacteraeota bacterium]
MRALDLLDASSADVLGFEWLCNAVAPVSPYGERLFSELVPFQPGSESSAEARARKVAATAAELGEERIDGVRAVLRAMPDAASAIARASMGDVLDDPSFLELRRFCAAIERIDGLVSPSSRGVPIANDGVRVLDEALAIAGNDERSFYLADAFDADLQIARERLAREQAELDASRGRESARAAQQLGRDEIAGSEFIVMRAELPGPLPAGVRVVREAPTYLLCALEYGEATLAALARRDEAATAVAQAEARVRAQLSATVRERAAELGAAAAALAELDVLLAAARFSQRYECAPASVPAEPVLAFEKARFLPLAGELEVAGRRFVPLDIDLHDTAVLTGPNMGGKSVSLQTCGFVALCVAFGLPVPAIGARVGLFDHVAWLGLGREAQIGGLLSSFAREVLELRAILARRAPRLLIFVDEFARTTTPHEGRALLVALLARLRQRGACGMVATHLAGIASVAGTRHFAVRGLRDMPARPQTAEIPAALAALAQAMDYTIEEVHGDEAPRADAVALTALLGIDDDFVEAAYRALAQ